MSISITDLLRHIIDEMNFLGNQTGISEEDFMDDEILQRAFTCSISIIGKAAKKLPADFREKYL